MNKTKKLTTGSMLLAILGALMFVDMRTGFLFLYSFMPCFAAIIIIVYSAKYEFKDGLTLAVCELILALVLGYAISVLAMPIGILVGVGYSYFFSKEYDKKKLLLISMFLFVIGELLIIYAIQPLFGTSVSSLIDAYNESFDLMINQLKQYDAYSQMDSVFLDLKSMVTYIFALGIIFTGVLEGMITHLVSIILLKRFKIKDISKGNIISIDLKPIPAYICMGLMMAMMFRGYVSNDTARHLLVSVGLIAVFVLMYYGYIFLALYLRLKYPNDKKVAIKILLATVLILIFSPYALAIIGFMYGAGPFKKALSRLNGKNI